MKPAKRTSIVLSFFLLLGNASLSLADLGTGRVSEKPKTSAIPLQAGGALPPVALVSFPEYGFEVGRLPASSSPGQFFTIMMHLPPSDDFAPNVNVVIQPYEEDAKSYVELSKKQFKKVGWELIGEPSVHGNTAVLEYQRELNGKELRHYAKAIWTGKQIFLATGTATQEQWQIYGADLIRSVNALRPLKQTKE